jgi:hypothetical protein
VKYKIIRLDERSRCYSGYFGDEIDLSRQFAAIENGIDEKLFNATQARAAIAELNDFLNDPAREKYIKPLFDTEYLGDTPDDDYAKGVFIYMPALIERVKHEVKIRELVHGLKTELEKIDLGEIKYSHFAQMLYMGVITKNRKTFRYTIDNEPQILYTMQNITDQYVDYDVFAAYLNLDPDVAEYLQKHAQNEENNLTDAQFIEIIKIIDGFILSYREKLDQLEKTFVDERDGLLKRVFYRTMLEVFLQEKKVLT